MEPRVGSKYSHSGTREDAPKCKQTVTHVWQIGEELGEDLIEQLFYREVAIEALNVSKVSN